MKIDKSLVKSFPLFEKMPDDDLERLLSQATIRRIPAGDAVFEQGGAATHFFLLLNGRLKVTQVTPDGQQIIYWTGTPGIADEGSTLEKLHIINRDGSGQRELLNLYP